MENLLMLVFSIISLLAALTEASPLNVCEVLSLRSSRHVSAWVPLGIQIVAIVVCFLGINAIRWMSMLAHWFVEANGALEALEGGRLRSSPAFAESVHRRSSELKKYSGPLSIGLKFVEHLSQGLGVGFGTFMFFLALEDLHSDCTSATAQQNSGLIAFILWFGSIVVFGCASVLIGHRTGSPLPHPHANRIHALRRSQQTRAPNGFDILLPDRPGNHIPLNLINQHPRPNDDTLSEINEQGHWLNVGQPHKACPIREAAGVDHVNGEDIDYGRATRSSTAVPPPPPRKALVAAPRRPRPRTLSWPSDGFLRVPSPAGSIRTPRSGRSISGTSATLTVNPPARRGTPKEENIPLFGRFVAAVKTRLNTAIAFYRYLFPVKPYHLPTRLEATDALLSKKPWRTSPITNTVLLILGYAILLFFLGCNTAAAAVGGTKAGFGWCIATLSILTAVLPFAFGSFIRKIYNPEDVGWIWMIPAVVLMSAGPLGMLRVRFPLDHGRNLLADAIFVAVGGGALMAGVGGSIVGPIMEFRENGLAFWKRAAGYFVKCTIYSLLALPLIIGMTKGFY